MIQSTPIKVMLGRDDAVFWPVINADRLTAPSGITAMQLICRKDGEQDVIINSADAPTAYDFLATGVMYGSIVTGISWKPGIAIGSKFTASGIWKAQVFLFDAVHTLGVYHGTFKLQVEAVEIVPPLPTGVLLLLGSWRAADLKPNSSANRSTSGQVRYKADLGASSFVAADELVADVTGVNSPMLVMAIGVNSSTTTVMGGISSITVGGVEVSQFRQLGGAINGNRNLAIALLPLTADVLAAMVGDDIEVQWPDAASTTLIGIQTAVFYNVGSTGFDEAGYVSLAWTGSGSGKTASLSVPEGGAVIAAERMQYTDSIAAPWSAEGGYYRYFDLVEQQNDQPLFGNSTPMYGLRLGYRLSSTFDSLPGSEALFGDAFDGPYGTPETPFSNNLIAGLVLYPSS